MDGGAIGGLTLEESSSDATVVVTSLDILSYHLAALMVVVAALEKNKMREERMWKMPLLS